jgi:DNA-binding GntR family transcriptional regulator
MSTTPIISALSKLEQEGLVTSKFNRGFFVSEISVEEANDLIEARWILEEYSVRKLIDTYTEEKFEYLKKLRENLDNYMPSSYTRKRLFLDSYFHIGIAEMAGNAYVSRLLADIFEKIYLRYRTERLPIERQMSANREHMLLLDAIQRKDKEEALKILEQHYMAVRRNLINTIIQKE